MINIDQLIAKYGTRQNKIITIVLLGVVCYALISLAVFDTDPIFKAINKILDSYLLFVFSIAGSILDRFGIKALIDNFDLYINDNFYILIEQNFLFKRWFLFLTIVTLITKTPLLHKLINVGILVVENFLVVVAVIVLMPIFDIHFYTPIEAKLLSQSVFSAVFFIHLYLWLFYHKTGFLRYFKNLGLDKSFIISRFHIAFVVLLLLNVVIKFVLGFFVLFPWINFIFNSTKHILDWVGYESIVDGLYLVGAEGSIYMAKYCLGINTIMVFASFVYLTGVRQKQKWIFIVFGTVILNLANILRMFFLFINIQNKGIDGLVYDLHDVYNYIIYGLTFVLWVIWLERYSDIWLYIRTNKKLKS